MGDGRRGQSPVGRVHFLKGDVMSIRVYCAGKIGKNDWRHELFPELRGIGSEVGIGRTWQPNAQPSFPKAGPERDGFMFAGPYFLGCDHGCYHGPNSHGMAAQDWSSDSHGRACGIRACGSGGDGVDPKVVIYQCLEGIRNADAVFVWLENLTAYGTMAEIGYAYAHQKPIWIYWPGENGSDTPWEPREPWFIEEMAISAHAVPNVQSAWDEFAYVASRMLHVIALQRMPYSEYLQTDHWKALRVQALAAAEYRCQVCNDTAALTVHHRTYERRGFELLSDLIALCRSCHSIFHGSGKLATSELPSTEERRRRAR